MRTPVLAAVVVALSLGLLGCGRLQGVPTGRGSTAYRVGELMVELPEDWVAKGDASRFGARSPDGLARVEAEQVTRAFATPAECLAHAEQALARGAAGLERPRHHPTRLGERAAWVMEADLRGWHGWAWAACDGATQYRLSFFGASPLAASAMAARRGVEASARFDVAR